MTIPITKPALARLLCLGVRPSSTLRFPLRAVGDRDDAEDQRDDRREPGGEEQERHADDPAREPRDRLVVRRLLRREAAASRLLRLLVARRRRVRILRRRLGGGSSRPAAWAAAIRPSRQNSVSIQSIIERSSLPSRSIWWFFCSSRMRLKFSWPARFSAIHSLANSP